MAAYVLVGGAWLGGWCWQRVARRLRDEGHEVYPVTLTGLGELVHLASSQINLGDPSTYCEDMRDFARFSRGAVLHQEPVSWA